MSISWSNRTSNKWEINLVVSASRIKANQGTVTILEWNGSANSLPMRSDSSYRKIKHKQQLHLPYLSTFIITT